MEELTAKYGLPKDVKFCTNCVISNQRPSSEIEFKHTSKTKKPTISFDKNGVCAACNFQIKKDTEIDWKDRLEALKVLLDEHRSKSGKYDVIVSGSGGKDSVYACYMLRKEFDMHPLTVTWSPHIYTDIGWKNFQSWIHAGYDNMLFTPNGKVHRLLTRLAVENLFHPFQPFILGQKNLAPKLAAMHDIPLIFYGENEAEYGNPIDENLTPKRDESYYSTQLDYDKIFLGGVSATSLMEDYGLEEQDMMPYLPADKNKLRDVGVEVRYMGYYTRWDPQEAYYKAVEHTGFEANPFRTEGTYSKYSSLDDRIDGFHYWTTYIKFGIGRATYDAAQEIRNEKITRDEGVRLVHKYDGEYPTRYLDEIMQYLDMTEERFLGLAEQFRSPHLWKKEDAEWKLRHVVDFKDGDINKREISGI